MAMAGTNDNTSRIARSAALTLVISVAVLYLGDRFGMAGKDAVVFELLMKDGYAVAAHADITDENQTVSLFEPEIGTTAKDGVDGDHHAVIDPEAVIVDTISYKDLIPGKEYTVKGTLMVKSTGEPLLGEDGKPVTAETTFTPDHDHGTVDVTFEFDGSSLKGDSVVVFETLYRDGKEITAHADIDDEGQTVEFTEPSLGTTAEDGIDGDQSLVADGKAVIVDNVSYKGLVPGKEYKVVGTLMLKDTGEPLLDANGKSVTAETTFTPDHDHGTVDVTFTFDASLLAGQQVVVFETLYRLDKEITVHADIEDENQTIEVIQPGVDTVAVDGFDGDKDVVADPEAEITDTLSYMGCPYLDADCAEGGLFGSANAVVFGHNLGFGDTSMFNAVASYTDASFAREHRRVLLQTPDERREFEVQAADCIGGWEAQKRTRFESEADFSQWYADRLVESDMRLTDEAVASPIVTLCTCSYNRWADNERTVVYAAPIGAEKSASENPQVDGAL